MSTALAIIIPFMIIVLTTLCKKYIKPKYGNTGVHVFTFLLCAIYTVCLGLYNTMPGFKELALDAISYLAICIAAYEVVLKKIGM